MLIQEEFDVLEDELDEMDPVKVNTGDLFGETLLSSCYTVAGDVSHDDLDIVNSPSPTVVHQHRDTSLHESENREDGSANRKNLSFR